jgi:hypothetical protein
MRVPRPLHVNSSAPTGWPATPTRNSDSRRSSSAAAASRTWKLHGRADLDEVADSHRAGRLVRAGDRPDQKVAASEFSFVFVDGKPNVQATGHQDLILHGQVRRDLLENLQRWPPGQLGDDGALGTGHGIRAANRAAALGHDRTDAQARHTHPHRTRGEHLIVAEQPGQPRLIGAACQPTQHRRSRRAGVEVCEQVMGREGVRVG